MSSRKMKAPDSPGTHPSLDPNPRTDDTGYPDTISPEVIEISDTSSEDLTSSGTEVLQARNEIENLFEEFEEPLENFLQGNRERFAAIITESFKTLEQKFEDVLKIQCERRQKLYQDYSLEMKNLKRELSKDAHQVKKFAKNLANIFKEQQEFIHESLGLQKKRLEEVKDLCEQYLEKIVKLRDSQGNSLIEELRSLIATLEIKLLRLNRQQESAAGQQSLLDLLFS